MGGFTAIILAAGEGTRMRSALPKVLHPVGGLPMLGHVARAASAAGAARIATVVGPGRSDVTELVRRLAGDCVSFEQVERLGTGHAVRMAKPAFAGQGQPTIVLFADNPLMRPETLGAVVARLQAGADMVVVGFEPDLPHGYGRLLMDGDRLSAIREEKDASADERAVRLCNSGVMGFGAGVLDRLIDRIENRNAKGEFYLTDAVELANADGLRVEVEMADPREVAGVNDRAQLAHAERIFQEFKREEIMAGGVTLAAPETVFFSYDTEIAPDVTIEPNVVFGPGVKIESGAVIHAFCHIEGAHVGPKASVGPFARLRPDAVLAEGAKVGNFVEVKKANIGPGAKVNHLTYIGDADIGAGANIGAGTITCNYDGLNKHRTIIGAGAFVGSNSSLVAPVAIGEGAYVGSGSVITHDVAPGALGVARARQSPDKPGFGARMAARKKN